MPPSDPDKLRSMPGAKESKPVTRFEPRQVELVRLTCPPSKAELEESISLPQLSLEETARRLMKPAEIHHIARPKRNRGTEQQLDGKTDGGIL